MSYTHYQCASGISAEGDSLMVHNKNPTGILNIKMKDHGLTSAFVLGKSDRDSLALQALGTVVAPIENFFKTAEHLAADTDATTLRHYAWMALRALEIQRDNEANAAAKEAKEEAEKARKRVDDQRAAVPLGLALFKHETGTNSHAVRWLDVKYHVGTDLVTVSSEDRDRWGEKALALAKPVPDTESFSICLRARREELARGLPDREHYMYLPQELKTAIQNLVIAEIRLGYHRV